MRRGGWRTAGRPPNWPAGAGLDAAHLSWVENGRPPMARIVGVVLLVG
jgi:hypothetical protein